MKFTIRKQVHSCFATMSSNDVWLEFDFELPFYPYEGLTIVKGDIEENIVVAYWDCNRKKMMLTAEEDTTFHDVKNCMKDYSDSPEFKKLIKEYKLLGWRD